MNGAYFQQQTLGALPRLAWLLSLCMLMFLLGCDRLTSLFQGSNLTIIASPDLTDVQPLAALIQQHTGIHVTFVFGDPIESMEDILSARIEMDAAWFADAHGLLSDPGAASRVRHQESIMTSPLAVGVSLSVAQSLGWDDPARNATLGWSAVTRAASTGQLAFAMNDPGALGQGWMALSGVATAAAMAQGRGPQSMPIDRLALADFLTGYCLTGHDSRELRSKFAEQQGQQINGWIDEESALLMLHRSGSLNEPLVLIYPREGLSTASYPFMLLNEARRHNYNKVLGFLKGPIAQHWLARHTLRRPTNPQVAAKMLGHFPPLPSPPDSTFTPDRAFSEGLLDIYLGEFRPPQTSAFLLDTRATMQGPEREQLIAALQNLASEPRTLSGRVDHMGPRDRLWVLPFAEQIGQGQWFQTPPMSSGVLSTPQPQSLSEFKPYITGLQTQNGQTGSALTESILAALTLMQSERAQKPLYRYSVVALTDGSGVSSDSLAHFQQAYAQLPPATHKIPVFWILFGNASQKNIQTLINLTGGKVFDARNTPLSKAFREIRSPVHGTFSVNRP